MSDLAVNVVWQEILRETRAGNIPHSRAISAPSEWHQEIITEYAGLILGAYRPGHPDLLIIGTEDKAANIDTCRDFMGDIALKPLETQKRLGVILSADTLNKNAANSLLKLAEEPPDHAVLLFLMTDGEYFLPTLRSRSRFSTIKADIRTEPRKIPENPSEWIAWLDSARKNDVDAIALELESWANYAADMNKFDLAERIYTLKLITEKKNLSVPMLCDLILLTLKEGSNYSEYILDDLR